MARLAPPIPAPPPTPHAPLPVPFPPIGPARQHESQIAMERTKALSAVEVEVQERLSGAMAVEVQGRVAELLPDAVQAVRGRLRCSAPCFVGVLRSCLL